MKPVEYYGNLPDVLSQQQIEAEFVAVLAADATSHAKDIAEALFELSDRQWHTYEIASEQLRQDAASMILLIWDANDADRAESLLATIAMLGLGDAFRQLLATESTCDPRVRALLDEANREFGTSVDDPYSGMKQ